MPETEKTENIDQKGRIEQTYAWANYFVTRLKIDLKNGDYRHKDDANRALRKTFEEFRHAFISLYDLVRHKDRFNKKLDVRIKKWININTARNRMPNKFYVDTVRLYEDFVSHLAALKVIDK